MYRQTATAQAKHKAPERFSSPRYSTGRKGQNSGGTRRERIQIAQLLVCLLLFLTAYVGKGVFPNKMLQVRDNIFTLITSNTDFRAVLGRLGASLSDNGKIIDDLGTFCVEVFGFGGGEAPEEQEARQTVQPADGLEAELQFLQGQPDRQALSNHYLFSGEDFMVDRAVQSEKSDIPQKSEAAKETPQKILPAGTVISYSDYSGEPLPNRYTMDQLSLGDLETAVPVLGHLNSTYGYRDHPINGKYSFHGGVDIGGQHGDPIAAFADGTVEYVGEDDSYGLYLQLDHGNGVKSFYAHCSKICVKKGQSVSLGEKIAEIGSTGSATGPHLHLELKYGNLHLNPTYYVEFLPKS